jgi:hypothetical protein
MNLEDKFINVVSHVSRGDLSIYLKASIGFVKIQYKEKWDDGLGNETLIRVINEKVAISTAPSSWEHLLKTLKVNGVSLTEFEESLDRRIDVEILTNHRSLVSLRDIFGNEYVDKVITGRGNKSVMEDFIDTLKGLTKSKPKPALSIVKSTEVSDES